MRVRGRRREEFGIHRKQLPMKALITGGAGFIGSYLAETLLRRGDDVRVVDNLSTGSRQNIRHLMESDRFEFLHGDIMDCGLTERAMRGMDIVYHFAAAVGVKYVMEHPLASLRCNVHGTDAVLESASRNGCVVVLASTSEVYGKSGKVPFREDDDLLIGPPTISRWGYACSKTLDELLAFAYGRERQTPIIIVRLFNVCGPRQTGCYGMVVPRFVRNALLGKPIEVHGNGTQSRSFAYVGDVTRAVLGLVDSGTALGQIFNIGSAEEVTINALARKVIDLTGSTSGIRYIPYQDVWGDSFEDIARRVPDVSKIQQWTGWKPQVHLDEVLKIVIAHEAAEFVREAGRRVFTSP